ncbi:HAMP domain-containing histidine kinase [Candidatus Thorarchaeota archaeon]|nr:MAG: HAMP domain-containing histidine kinase [Candidatus Thorarchaeota archaeon]
MGDSSGILTKFKSAVKILIGIPRRITEPSMAISDEVTRRKARFLSLSLLVSTGVFPILQITSEVTSGIPIYSGLSFFLAGLYLLSRTEYVRLTSVITIAIAALLPFAILLLHPIWTLAQLGLQLLPWPILAALLGSQLLRTKEEAILVILMTTGLTLLAYVHPGIVFYDAIKLIGVAFAVETLLWFTCWTGEYYSTKLEQANTTLDMRRRELEIYTSLLRHDLSNDIQMILGGLELAQMTSDDANRQSSFLESTLAAAERMRSLIHVFSLSEEDLENDFLSILRSICNRAELAFKGMSIQVNATEEVEKNPLYYGRLTALAFENLLRNTAQHGGENPNIKIDMQIEHQSLIIHFEDDGPGISPQIREQLFGRGVSTSTKGRGLGLYLTKMIIESEGGSIRLIDPTDKGCHFQITLPLKV